MKTEEVKQQLLALQAKRLELELRLEHARSVVAHLDRELETCEHRIECYQAALAEGSHPTK